MSPTPARLGEPLRTGWRRRRLGPPQLQGRAAEQALGNEHVGRDRGNIASSTNAWRPGCWMSRSPRRKRAAYCRPSASQTSRKPDSTPRPSLLPRMRIADLAGCLANANEECSLGELTAGDVGGAGKLRPVLRGWPSHLRLLSCPWRPRIHCGQARLNPARTGRVLAVRSRGGPQWLTRFTADRASGTCQRL